MPKIPSPLSYNNCVPQKTNEEANSSNKIISETLCDDLNEINSIFSKLSNHIVKSLSKLSADDSIKKSSKKIY